MKTHLSKTIILSTVLAIASFAVQAKETLKLNLKQGTSYFQNSTVESKIKQTVNGQTMDVSVDVISKMSFEVLKSTAEFYTLNCRITFISMTIGSDFGSMAMASDKVEANNPMTKILKALTESSFPVQLGTDGKVQEVGNLDTMITRIFDQTPELPQMQRAQFESHLKRSYSQAAMKGNIETSTDIFSLTKVNVNDTWDNEIALNAGMKSTLTNQFTLTEYNKQTATITVKSTIKPVAANDTVMVNGMPTQTILEGTMYGTIKVDSQTGWIVEAEYNQELKGAVNVFNNDQVPGGMKIPMEIKTKTKISDK